MYYSITVLGTGVEWDDDKNEVNKREHEGLGFELAQLVFADPNRLERIDRSENNTSSEERWQTLGIAEKLSWELPDRRYGLVKSQLRNS
jgi:uncharacterized DUF497 family protein